MELAMPTLDQYDQPVVLEWQNVWKRTPFQTIKYFARLHNPEQPDLYQDLPGGNCFDFAKAFAQGNTTISNPRIMSYAINVKTTHGLCSCVNKAHPERAYNCDSGFFSLIKMPPREETLYYIKGPKRMAGPPPQPGTQRQEGQYRCTYASAVWGTDFYPANKNVPVVMGAIQASDADNMAYDNAKRQSGALYLPRMMSNEGFPSWGDQVIFFFGSDKKGTVVFTWVNPGGEVEPQTTIDLRDDNQYFNLLPEAFAKLFGRYAAAGLYDSGQLPGAMLDCMQFVLDKLVDEVRTQGGI